MREESWPPPFLFCVIWMMFVVTFTAVVYMVALFWAGFDYIEAAKLVGYFTKEEPGAGIIILGCWYLASGLFTAAHVASSFYDEKNAEEKPEGK